MLTTPSSCPQAVAFEDDFILSAGTEPYVYKWSINGELRTKFPCSANSVFALDVNEKLHKVLAISGASCKVDISTNFEYKAFSLTMNTWKHICNEIRHVVMWKFAYCVRTVTMNRSKMPFTMNKWKIICIWYCKLQNGKWIIVDTNHYTWHYVSNRMEKDIVISLSKLDLEKCHGYLHICCYEEWIELECYIRIMCKCIIQCLLFGPIEKRKY